MKEKFNLKYDMYLLSMKVSLPEGIKDKNSLVENDLSKILPKNIISGGYLCTICETYLSNYPHAMCTACYEYDIESISNPDMPWFDEDLLNERQSNLDYVFVTPSNSKCELTNDDFSKLENIKVLSFRKVDPYEAAIEAQHDIIYDDGKFIFTDELNDEVTCYYI